MKILVLMPLNEQSVYYATGIYRSLSDYAKNHTFAMPMFEQYCMSTGTSQNWTEALFDTVIAARDVYKIAEKDNDDLIIIGNTYKNFAFDAIFNFQDDETAMPYEDLFLKKVKSVISTDEKLVPYLENLYGADDSSMALKNIAATANFLSAYLETDPHLEDIETEYKEKISAIKGIKETDGN